MVVAAARRAAAVVAREVVPERVGTVWAHGTRRGGELQVVLVLCSHAVRVRAPVVPRHVDPTCQEQNEIQDAVTGKEIDNGLSFASDPSTPFETF